MVEDSGAGLSVSGKAMPRPLSPHLQVYKPQLTSILSILHRATGVWLGMGTTLLVWWFLAIVNGPVAFGHMQGFIKSPFGLILLAGWTWSLFYHLANGIRHLAWDTGYGFSLKSTYLTGWIVVLISFVMTGLVWAVGFHFL